MEQSEQGRCPCAGTGEGCRAGRHSPAASAQGPQASRRHRALCPYPPSAPRKLIGIAFGDLNPFPLRQIRNRRAYHLEKVRLELTELEAIREDFLRERDASPDKGALVSDEEDT